MKKAFDILSTITQAHPELRDDLDTLQEIFADQACVLVSTTNERDKFKQIAEQAAVLAKFVAQVDLALQQLTRVLEKTAQ